jgi:hypothetical protein
MATKFCIFCGKRPECKNKEHVIPRWLIELTGDPKRVARFGVDFQSDPPKWREFSFDSLTFPACTKCNSDFSNLESDARTIVESVLSHQPLTESQVSILLDWLDKVRVGLWLGYLYLDRNPQQIRPQYHIATRIGQTDRTVAILRTKNRPPGINFCGPESPCFQGQPTCFALMINDICFYNVAGISVCSRRLGFPYVTPKHLRDDSKLEVTIAGGTGRVMRPVIKKLMVPHAVLLHQAILPGWLTKGDNEYELFNTEWVKSRSLNWKDGTGGVFVEKDCVVHRYPSAPSLDWLPREARDFREISILIGSLVYERLIDDLEEAARLSGKERRKYMMAGSAQFRRVHDALLSLMGPRLGRN